MSFLRPVAIYKDPFRRGDNIIVPLLPPIATALWMWPLKMTIVAVNSKAVTCDICMAVHSLLEESRLPEW